MRKSLYFALEKTALSAVTWWFAPLGGFIAAGLLWALGVPMTFSHWLPDNAVLRAAFDVLVCVIVAYAIIFLAWLIWSPVHFKLQPHGGARASLQAKLGVNMWPVILMVSGICLFVLLFGVGAVLFVMQSGHQTQPSSQERAHIVYEVQRQLETIDSIREILTRNVRKIGIDAVTAHQMISRDLESGKRTTDAIASLTAIADSAERQLNEIQSIMDSRTEYPYLRQAVSFSSPNPYGLVAGARNLASDIKALSPDGDTRFLLRSQSFAEFSNHAQSIGSWATQCDSKLLTARRAVEELPVYKAR